jgi:D-arabinose 1-dehydrogenase-like Zn-dependent alcohol dehydrogenase
MKAAVLQETGAPEILQIEDVPIPQPGPTEVLIKVAASDHMTNFVDAVDLVACGAVKPVVQQFALSDVAEAWQRATVGSTHECSLTSQARDGVP